MKNLLALYILLSISALPDIVEIRSKYKKALESETETHSGLKELAGVNKTNPLLYAYKGAFTALLAKHADNPYTKLEKVKLASAILNDAVSADGEHIEIRYLRYSIEKNIPSFLPYREHIAADEDKILKSLKNNTDKLNPDLKKEVAAFMLKNGQLEPEEKKLLESLTR